MADQDGLAINENANRNPNQNQNQAEGIAQNDDQGQNPPPHYPFLANAPIAPGVPQRPQLNCSHFKPNMQVKQKKMQKHIYLGQMTGWTHMTFRIT